MLISTKNICTSEKCIDTVLIILNYIIIIAFANFLLSNTFLHNILIAPDDYIPIYIIIMIYILSIMFYPVYRVASLEYFKVVNNGEHHNQDKRYLHALKALSVILMIISLIVSFFIILQCLASIKILVTIGGVIMLLSFVIYLIILAIIVCGIMRWELLYYIISRRKKSIINNINNYVKTQSKDDQIFNIEKIMKKINKNKTIDDIIENVANDGIIEIYADNEDVVNDNIINCKRSQAKNNNIKDFVLEYNEELLEEKKIIKIYILFNNLYCALIYSPLYLGTTYSFAYITGYTMPDKYELFMRPLDIILITTYYLVPILNMLLYTFLSSNCKLLYKILCISINLLVCIMMINLFFVKS